MIKWYGTLNTKTASYHVERAALCYAPLLFVIGSAKS